MVSPKQHGYLDTKTIKHSLNQTMPGLTSFKGGQERGLKDTDMMLIHTTTREVFFYINYLA